VAVVVGAFTLAHLENGIFKLLIFVFSKFRSRLTKANQMPHVKVLLNNHNKD
jgi:hypothetical protein